ncbi:hypothetical protein PMI35_03724 [Pseudomonas sp. GM78]|nr:hypothetical protein PMI35_03724 [Pseudomonas sp. GM78]
MSTIKLLKKVSAGTPGNFNYIYECTCGNGSKKTVTISAANDNEAKILAQMECDDKCGES